MGSMVAGGIFGGYTRRIFVQLVNLAVTVGTNVTIGMSLILQYLRDKALILIKVAARSVSILVPDAPVWVAIPELATTIAARVRRSSAVLLRRGADALFKSDGKG